MANPWLLDTAEETISCEKSLVSSDNTASVPNESNIQSSQRKNSSSFLSSLQSQAGSSNPTEQVSFQKSSPRRTRPSPLKLNSNQIQDMNSMLDKEVKPTASPSLDLGQMDGSKDKNHLFFNPGLEISPLPKR